MRLPDFEALVRRLAEQIPAEFFEGIAEVVVSPRTVAHPERGGIWTLGECIPLATEDPDPRYLHSRVVLYHGSFQALAHDTPEFDWEGEAWETLTHEVRHHVEWKARAPDLDALDRAAEANFARQDGEAFDPQYYRDGVPLRHGVWQIEDDVFLEQLVKKVAPTARFRWGGAELEVPVPPGTTLPAFLTVSGAPEPPPGELVLVLQPPTSLRSLFRSPPVFAAEVEARQLPD